MRAVLLSLYPKAWREQYGEEYAALLEDTGMSAKVVWDIIKTAFILQLRARVGNLVVLAATALYALSGMMCICLGLTDNWPIWAPTSLVRAIGLAITLMPLIYALYIQFSALGERKRQWRGSHPVFWLVISPFTILSTLLLAFMCFFCLISTGFFGVSSGVAFVCRMLCMAGISMGLAKSLGFLQGQLLRRLTA